MSESCAPALAHTAPPTVPGMASPNSRPDRPAWPWPGWPPGHGQPGVGHEPRPVDAAPLRADHDHEPAHAGVADDQVRAAADEDQGDVARAREAHDAAQLEEVVHLREQVGRTADAHRREARQRLLARRLDAQPALDVRAQRAPRRRCRGAGRRTEAARSISGREPGRGASTLGGLRQRPCSARARSRSAACRRRARADPGRGCAGPSPPRAGRRPGWPARPERAGAIERPRRRPAARHRPRDEARGVGALVAGRVRVGHDDHGQAGGRQPRPASRSRRGPTSRSAADERLGHVLAQERDTGRYRSRRSAGSASRARQRVGEGGLAGDVDARRARSTRAGSGRGHGLVEAAHRLRSAEDRAGRAVRRQPQPVARPRRGPGRPRARMGVPVR